MIVNLTFVYLDIQAYLVYIMTVNLSFTYLYIKDNV